MLTRHRTAIIILALLVAWPLMAGTARAAPYKGFARAEALISAPELKAHIDKGDSNTVVIAVAREWQYRLGHVPGAFAAWRADYGAGPGEYPYGGMVADRAKFEAFARRLGISAHTRVVIYDHEYDATRLWWVFHLYGKADVRVLDGGYGAWKAAGYGSDILAPDAPPPGDFTATSGPADWSTDSAYIATHDASRPMQIWDVRDEPEWRGETLLPGALRAGHIPGARHLNWRRFRDKTGGFLAAGPMTALLNRSGFDRDADQVFYCHSGVRATQELFALYLLGWDQARLHNYDGAWIAWSHEPANPVICEAC